MAYLAIKKVKGNFYAYRQESYRDGDKVRTRTLEYLGAIDGKTADLIKNTRKQLARLDMKATAKDARESVGEIIKPPEEVQENALEADLGGNRTTNPPDTTKPNQKAGVDPHEDLHRSKSKGDPHLVEMRVNGVLSLINISTGELVGHISSASRYQQKTLNGETVLVDMASGEVIETPKPEKQVITTNEPEQKPPSPDTKNAAPTQKPNRPFHESLKLPKTLKDYGVSTKYLGFKHIRFGNRLKAIGINPSIMPDIVFKYGHPDSLKRKRDGSFVITISRRTQNAVHTVHKGKLWEHYRQALTSGYLEALRQAKPDRYNAIATKLDHSHQRTKAFILDSFRYANNLTDRIRLSLQLMIFDTIPKTHHKANPFSYGQMDFTTVNNWQAETVKVLCEVEKSGWTKTHDKAKRTVANIKGKITHKAHEIEQLNRFQKLSGKRRKLVRELMKLESRLRASQTFQSRLQTIETAFEFY